jgi:hypothetical protein
MRGAYLNQVIKSQNKIIYVIKSQNKIIYVLNIYIRWK